jgi:2-polyprenyl-3-methyl-5-hydroxy-6-metoxy-1,4-benzoquinol methylase
VNSNPESVAPSGTLRELLYARYVSSFKDEHGGAGHDLPSSRRAWLKRRVLPLLGHLPRTTRICELGCGDGGFLGFLRESGFDDVHGVDWSAEQVALAQARGLDVSAGDLFDVLVAAHEAFDLVVAIDVIEHLSHEQLLRFGPLLMQAIRSGGMLLVQTPNGEGLFAGHVIHGDLTHSTIFNESSIKQYLRAFGFEDIQVAETGPVPYGLRGMARCFLWNIFRFVGQAAVAVECGRIPRVLTQEFLCTARKPRNAAG